MHRPLERLEDKADNDNFFIFSRLLREGLVEVVPGVGEVVLTTDRAGGEVSLTLDLALFLTTNEFCVGRDLSVVMVMVWPPEPRTGLSWILNVILAIMIVGQSLPWGPQLWPAGWTVQASLWSSLVVVNQS